MAQANISELCAEGHRFVCCWEPRFVPCHVLKSYRILYSDPQLLELQTDLQIHVHVHCRMS